MILSAPTKASDAAKAAKTLLGSFAHLRPDNPDVFVASIAAVLAQYPLGLVEEVVDPRRGLARTVEFLSVKSLVEWCDARLAFYQGLAAYQERVPETPRQTTPEQEERGIAAVRGLLRCLKEQRDIASLTIEQAVELGSEAKP